LPHRFLINRRARASVLRESDMFSPPLESHHGNVRGVGKYAR
jgi:hypothetical protein